MIQSELSIVATTLAEAGDRMSSAATLNKLVIFSIKITTVNVTR